MWSNQSEITIHKIKSEDQPANALMKPLINILFVKYWKQINGW
jgi:hypothetical protein